MEPNDLNLHTSLLLLWAGGGTRTVSTLLYIVHIAYLLVHLYSPFHSSFYGNRLVLYWILQEVVKWCFLVYSVNYLQCLLLTRTNWVGGQNTLPLVWDYGLQKPPLSFGPIHGVGWLSTTNTRLPCVNIEWFLPESKTLLAANLHNDITYTYWGKTLAVVCGQMYGESKRISRSTSLLHNQSSPCNGNC